MKDNSQNQLWDYLDTKKQVEQVTSGSCFHSICFFLLDEQQVEYKASCIGGRVGEVSYLTQIEGKQEVKEEV